MVALITRLPAVNVLATVPPGPYDPDTLELASDNGAGGYDLEAQGVTFTFNKPVRFLRTPNDDAVVITRADLFQSGTQIVATSEPSVVANGYRKNGMVRNPKFTMLSGDAHPRQGWDAAHYDTTPDSSQRYIYVDDMNEDPDYKGPISLSPGQAVSFVKQVRDTSASVTAWRVTRKYVALSFMPTLPPTEGTWFRPPVSPSAKSWPAKRVEDIDFSGGAGSPLRNLTKPSQVSNPSVYLAQIEDNDLGTPAIWQDTYWGRRLQLTGAPTAFPSNYESNGYSRGTGRQRGLYHCSLHIDQSGSPTEQAARQALACWMIQWGIDVDGAHLAGYRHSHGAGQWHGYIESYYLAAFMLGDAAMLGRAKLHRSNEIGQFHWIGEEHVGAAVEWDSGTDGNSTKHAGETYRPEHVGKPEWGKDGWQSENINAADMAGMSSTFFQSLDANPNAAYRDVAFTGPILAMLPVMLMRNSPNGLTGIEEINRIGAGAAVNGAIGPGNPASAVLAWIDRSMTWKPLYHGFSTWHNGQASNVHTAWRGEVRDSAGVMIPLWTGRPDVHNQTDRPVFAAGAGSGEIAFNTVVSGDTYNYATEAVTGRFLAWSQDGVQFADEIDIGTAASHTLTGLRPGTPHWCRWRQASASGSSETTPTWVQNLASANVDAAYKADRGKVTAGGSAPSGTPALACDVAPKVMYRPYPASLMPYYEPAPDGLAVGTKLYAGLGGWSGGSGAPAITYDEDYLVQTISGWTVTRQWRRDGVNISGATGWTYTLQAADSGHDIDFVETVEGVQATAAAVLAA